ncbi:hypothetical protein EV421DRAFT_1992782 [Armillaria borealis]|uniref:Uncharacterized protein n=1 Tax=Armillaria borealis TaxID=47425 RepID=A0AA39MGP8_9AGAR|nr:hypothetical protein EV421DRAFT_1992782 [Armillaria borealis]
MSPKQVSRHQSPSRVFCCFITALSFTIVVPTVWITAALWLRSVGDLDYFADFENTDRSLVLFVDLVSANILHGTMLAEWSVEKDTCPYSNCTEVEIFFDMHLSSSDPRYGGGSCNNNALTVPIFIWNATMAGTRQGEDAPSFRTKLTLSTSDNYQNYYSGHSYEKSLVYYPFDRNDRFAIVPAGRPRWEETDRIFDMDLSLQRNTLVIVYCLVITFTFWLVTLMICLIMIATVVFGFRQRNEIIVVPIGTVFTFTQLRSSMPGAPEGFHLVGLLPCLILLSISAIAMVGIYLFADPDDPSRRTFTWNELEKALLHYSKRISTTSKECVRRARFCVLTARRIWRRMPHHVDIPLVNTASENPV